MTRLALQPASTGDALTHYRDTIDGTQPLADLRGLLSAAHFTRLGEIYPDGQVTVWGGVQGNRSKIAKLEPGDVCWFYRRGEFIASCQVELVILDAPTLANALWDPDPDKGSFRHVFFLSKPQAIQIPWAPVREFKGYKENYTPQSLHVLEPSESAELLAMFGEGTDLDEVSDVAVEAIEATAESRRHDGQGYASSAALRKAVEMHAVHMATTYFEVMGYSVVEHGAPFDLHCTKGGKELFVEVKGTQSSGTEVFLTKNEVNLAKDDSKESVLYIHHSISVSHNGDGEVIAEGGHPSVLWPWKPSNDDLLALTYRYRVPTRG